MNEILKKRIDNVPYKKVLPIDVNDAYKEGFKNGAEYILSHQWISVEDALPEYDELVIVAFGYDDYALSHRSNNPNALTDKNGFCNYGYKEVLSWLPIPKFEPKSSEYG